MITFGHELGLTVVAEGVETARQRDCLRALHCELAQGYLLGRPGPPEELAGATGWGRIGRGCRLTRRACWPIDSVSGGPP
jgi:predicted signal transduction protein with EAL and GGDEF domain